MVVCDRCEREFEPGTECECEGYADESEMLDVVIYARDKALAENERLLRFIRILHDQLDQGWDKRALEYDLQSVNWVHGQMGGFLHDGKIHIETLDELERDSAFQAEAGEG